MTLFELLSVMVPKDYVIIIDLENKRMSNPMKIGNVSMEKLRNTGSKDVYHVGYNKQRHCFFVKVGDVRRVKTELSMWHVVDTRLRQLGLMERVEQGIAEGR